MRQITRLQPQQGAVRRTSVFVDDSYLAGLSARAVRELDLHVGREVTPELEQAILCRSVRESALSSLARRDHSRAELAGKLKLKGFPGTIIAAALNGLEQEGLVDDRRFAHGWIARRRASHPRGRRLVARELEHKGVSPEIARRALETDFPEEAERGDLVALIRKRLRHSRPGDLRVFKRRLLGFLARRGFSYDDVRRVLAEHFPELERISTGDAEDAGVG